MPKRGGTKPTDAARVRQARSKELNKKYRAEAALLKKKGVLSSNVNARKNISRATRTKINKFRDVIEGRAIAVPAPKNVREKYAASGILETGLLKERGRYLIAPKTFEGQKAKLRKGQLVEVTRPLKNGQETYVILPYGPTDLPALIKALQTDETLDGLKMPDELFSFRINGHNSRDSFVTTAEMGEYLQRYQSIIDRSIVGLEMPSLTFQRFKLKKGGQSDLRNPNNTETRIYDLNKVDGKRRRSEANGRNDWYENKKRATDAERKAKQRAQETEAQRKARLDAQRIRSSQNRQRKFLNQ